MSKRKANTFTAALTVVTLWTVAFFFSLLFIDCVNNSGHDIATPRRTAYPRIEIYDSVYLPIESMPINIEVNAHTILQEDSLRDNSDGSRWINIMYPGYNATLHCTFTPVNATTVGTVTGNRNERMSLNAGDLTSELTEITTPHGTTGRILTTPESTVTPLQFIATDNRSWVFSGALYLTRQHTGNIDSIAPILHSVRRDIVHSIRNLRQK
ncbi:MAG: hypothetical protein IJY31_05505 [Muribaculaceae bacterium]|nr:hypothetical protein [Muribaculaceae bacterium]